MRRFIVLKERDTNRVLHYRSYNPRLYILGYNPENTTYWSQMRSVHRGRYWRDYISDRPRYVIEDLGPEEFSKDTGYVKIVASDEARV